MDPRQLRKRFNILMNMRALLDQFDETLLVPKIEVVETINAQDKYSNSTPVQAENTDSSLKILIVVGKFIMQF